MNRFARAFCVAFAALAPATVGLALPSPAGAPPGQPSPIPFEVDAGGGVSLRGHVYLPAGGTAPFATVLEYSPYWNTVYGPSEDPDTMAIVHLDDFLEAGFAVALVNMRGTGESDGCMQWGGPLDWADAALVVTTLANQSWSNGAVGMFGISYPGWTQYMAVAGAPPALKAVVPMSGVIDFWSLLTRNGAPIALGPATTTFFTALTGAGAGGAVSVLGPVLGSPVKPFVPDTSPEHLACPRYAEDVEASASLVADGDRTPYFDARDLRPAIATSSVAVFATNGLADAEGHILQFEGLWDALPADRRLMLGQWGHELPHDHRDDFGDLAVAWFDHHLRGGPERTATGVVEYQLDSGAWRTADRWPPPSAPVSLALSGTRLVPEGDPVADAVQSFESHDAHDADGAPIPLPVAASACGPGLQASYVSPPLVDDVMLAGNFEVDLALTSTLPDGNLGAFLYHTPGDGTCGDDGLQEVRRALTDLRHARTRDGHGSAFPVLAETDVRLVSHAFASAIPTGHRLVLVVVGGSVELAPEAAKPVLSVATGGGRVGSVTLPVVEGTLAFAPA